MTPAVDLLRQLWPMWWAWQKWPSGWAPNWDVWAEEASTTWVALGVHSSPPPCHSARKGRWKVLWFNGCLKAGQSCPKPKCRRNPMRYFCKNIISGGQFDEICFIHFLLQILPIRGPWPFAASLASPSTMARVMWPAIRKTWTAAGLILSPILKWKDIGFEYVSTDGDVFSVFKCFVLTYSPTSSSLWRGSDGKRLSWNILCSSGILLATSGVFAAYMMTGGNWRSDDLSVGKRWIQPCGILK